MTLSEYLSAKKLTRAQFAEMLGVHAVTVSKWCSGAMRPEWSRLRAIADATDGAVTAEDFLPAEAAP